MLLDKQLKPTWLRLGFPVAGGHSHGQEDEGWQCNLGVYGMVQGAVPTKRKCGKGSPILGIISALQ